VTDPIIYRITKAAQRLDVSRATVYRLAKAGHLKLVKISKGASGITAQSLDAHIRNIGASAQN
jgi:excisionase family DNA binding protein